MAAGRPDAATRYTAEVSCICQLQKVVAWCQARNVSVTFDRKMSALYDSETKSIRCNAGTSPTIQLYLLLHECGHLLIGTRHQTDRFGSGYVASGDIKRTLVHRIDIVDEELEAWHRGKKLANRLRLCLDEEGYNRYRAQLVKTYMAWALRVDGYGGRIEDATEKAQG
jgi:hypothetical protein